MSKFLKHVAQLVSGSVIAQMIGLLFTPVITRLYDPADFGILQLFLSLSSIIVAFAALSYDRAILLPKEDDESASVVLLCVLLISTVSLITAVIMILLPDEVGAILNAPQVAPYLVFVPFAVFITSIISVSNAWLSRRQRFGVIASAQVANTVMSKGVQAGAGYVSAASIGLIIGWIVGYCSSLALLLSQVKDDVSLFRTVTIDRAKKMAIRYKNFPIYTSWSTIANTLSTQIAPLLLVYYFDATVVGYYSLANMVVFTPMALIGTATAQVFFQRACEEKNRSGSIKNIVREVQQRLISIAMLPMFLLLIAGTDLFTVVLGSEWTIAGAYAGILAPWLLLVFIASPLGSIFSVLEKQAVDLTFNILILISRFVVLIIGGLSGSPTVALILYSTTGVAFWGGMNLYLLKISGISYGTGLNEYVKFFILAFIISIPLIVVKLLSASATIILVVAGLVSIVYYAYIVHSDPVLKTEITGVLRRLSHGYRNSSRK